MALAVAGLVAEGRTVIDGAERVADSFPGFVTALQGLGASVTVAAGLAASAAASAAPEPSASAQDDIFATLEKLADLRGKGILSEEEFTAKKAELLGRL